MIEKPQKKVKEPRPLQRKSPLKAKQNKDNPYSSFKPVTEIKLKKTKLKSRSKVSYRWEAYRADWLKRNPPAWNGNYTCGICGQFVEAKEVTLDHKIPRSRRPDLRYSDDNIVPAHALCNQLKGST